VIDRLRVLLDRPLDPAVGRAVLALSAAVFVGFAALVVLAGAERSEKAAPAQARLAQTPNADATPPARPPAQRPAAAKARRQDPQDRKGTSAARHASRELRDHAALQHVPYRDDGLAIALVGARHGKAILSVKAATRHAAVRGWRAFLRRFHDPGRSYRPHFKASRGLRG
jgi:hypothetical protein